MNALSGILLALAQREKSGVGTSVKVSLFDGAADWMSVPILHQKYTGEGPKRMGLKHPSISPYGEYRSVDNKVVVISIQNNREWHRFCSEVLKKPSLAEDERFITNNKRVENRQDIDAYISECFGQLSIQKLKRLLYRSGIAFGAVNHTEDLVTHPQLRYVNVDTPSGVVEIVASPVIIGKEVPSYGRIPSLGEHTESIINEFSE